ncbi:MAG: AAA family ATPase, partial [Planctomycetes bacterium]|nr:AAA family ATPase [Planctomycetota bacterium]
MQPISDGISDYEKICRQRCVYVDKTAYFHRLITIPGNNLYFLARPRRFGKSLMISTFKAIFEGRRKLFKGLAIDKTDYDWATHPVLQFNLGFCANEDYGDFAKDFTRLVKNALTEVGVA